MAGEGVVRPPEASTVRMAERLARITRESNPRDNPFRNAEQAVFWEGVLAKTTEPGEQQMVLYQLAIQLAHAGRSEQAAEQFRQLLLQGREPGRELPARVALECILRMGAAYLRLGEQENCLNHHGADSCLFPIAGGGVHRLPRGSVNALRAFEAFQRQVPDHLGCRWLINLAHMTLGQYPDQVPPGLLIPPSAFASEYPLPRFPDVAPATGLDVEDLSGGSVTEDFDGDGRLDVMCSAMGLASPLRYFRNTGTGQFAEETETAGLAGLTGGLNLVSGDYDNDGRVDVLVLRGGWMGAAGAYPRSLLRNLGGGRFEDVTEAAGLLEAEPSQTAVWFDFDGDGWLDLYVGHESVPARPSVCRLYWNNRRGGFVECAAAAGVAVSAFVKGVTAGDYNNDGRPDLYLSLRDAPNRLFRNDGPVAPAASGDGGLPRWKFTDTTTAAGVAEPIRSFPTWFFDYDQDGWLDLYVGGYGISNVGEIVSDVLDQLSEGEKPRLYRNRRDGTFVDVSREVRLDRVILGMGGNFGDLDNDGWLDLYLGTGDPEFTTLVPNRMFRNDAGRRFQDVTTSGGFGHLQKGHGVSFADLDNDGDQDIYHVLGGAYSGDVYRNALFLNPGNTNHWITLKLEGTRANRSGMGARVKLVVTEGAKTREIHRVVGTGGSFGCNPTRLEVGLGSAGTVQSMEILWPGSGTRQTLTNLAANRFYRIREGAEQPEPWNPPATKLGGPGTPPR